MKKEKSKKEMMKKKKRARILMICLFFTDDGKKLMKQFVSLIIFYRRKFRWQIGNKTNHFINRILPMENERTIVVVPNFQIPTDNLSVIFEKEFMMKNKKKIIYLILNYRRIFHR